MVDGDYIFFYTLFATKESIEIAKRISEFLSLVSNAKFVIGTSFHCIVFSIIFNKPFFAINGMWDKRISSLLSTMGLESRSVKAENLAEKLKTIFEIDFTNANQEIKKQQERAKEFLLNALSTEE